MASECPSHLGRTADKKRHDTNIGTLYFFQYNRPGDIRCRIHANDLVKNFTTLSVGTDNDNILNISVYESALLPGGLTLGVVYHAFLLIDTENWYYSMETSENNITLQRSKEVMDVRDKDLSNDRSRVRCAIKAEGDRTIKDLLKYLVKEKLLFDEYNLFAKNCKHFAKKIFDEFNSERKKYEFTDTRY